MQEDQLHVPVLLQEAIQALNISPGAIVIDATYGRGGHAEEIMKRLDSSGRLLALDRDRDAVVAARTRFGSDARVIVEQAPFSRLESCCERHGMVGHVSAVLFDLGVSSPQLDDPGRGFSFHRDGPLDMRMDRGAGQSAAQWLATADASEIEHVIREYGEERYARRIARTIVQRRQLEPITTTHALAEIVATAVPTRERTKNPATRTFQALRIHINNELDELRVALPQAVRVTAPGARVAVISFHSLEDRVVKRFFSAEAKGPEIPPEIPLLHGSLRVRLKLVGRPVRAQPAEIARNPRARSATLRVVERTEVADV